MLTGFGDVVGKSARRSCIAQNTNVIQPSASVLLSSAPTDAACRLADVNPKANPRCKLRAVYFSESLALSLFHALESLTLSN